MLQHPSQLPHQYPFRLVDSRAGGVTVALTGGAPWFRSQPGLPLTLAIEIMAQASHVLLGGSPGVYLAGIEGGELLEPVGVGDELSAFADLAGSFGQMIRVLARLECEERVVARATLILVGLSPAD